MHTHFVCFVMSRLICLKLRRWSDHSNARYVLWTFIGCLWIENGLLTLLSVSGISLVLQILNSRVVAYSILLGKVGERGLLGHGCLLGRIYYYVFIIVLLRSVLLFTLYFGLRNITQTSTQCLQINTCL